MSTLSVTTIKSLTASTPPVIQDSAGTEIGTFCRAWVNFNGTGTVAIRAAFNVSSITDNGVGDYTVNFATAMSDANYGYASSGSIRDTFDNATALICGADRNVAPTVGTLRINTVYVLSNVYTLIDGAEVCFSIFR